MPTLMREDLINLYSSYLFGGHNARIYFRRFLLLARFTLGRSTMNEYDDLSLYDPSLQEAVLYELEMLEPMPRREPIYCRPRPRQTRSEVPPLVVESTLIAAPSSQQGTQAQVQKKSSNLLLWLAVSVIVLLGVIGALGGAKSTTTPSKPTMTASQTLQRIAQLDDRQYATPSEHSTWAASACSTASMTEVINAYEALRSSNTTYRITDVLKVEDTEGQITPELGLLYGLTSIQKTVAPFHFKATALQPATLENVVQTAQAGQPVIIGFRDSYWFPTGHILVVKGGDSKNVNLADSSKLNWTKMSRSEFMKFWTGFAVLVEPA